MALIDQTSKEVDLSPGGCGDKFGSGWACVLSFRGRSKIIRGTASSRSEFRLQLLAVVNGLKQLKYPCIVKLHTRSEYLLECCGQVIARKRSHPSSSFVARVHQQKAKNWDLWQEFEQLSKIHCIRLCPVPQWPRHEDSFCAARVASNLPVEGRYQPIPYSVPG